MSVEAMTREDLIEFVATNVTPEEIWPDYLIFESVFDAEDYVMSNRDYIHEDEVPEWAVEHGYVNEDDLADP